MLCHGCNVSLKDQSKRTYVCDELQVYYCKDCKSGVQYDLRKVKSDKDLLIPPEAAEDETVDRL